MTQSFIDAEDFCDDVT